MRRALLALPLLFATPAYAQTRPETQVTKPAYPETRRVQVVEEQFGVKVADPYRWLENDVRNDKEVADWVAAQNKVTDAYLATLPGRDQFAARIKTLFNYERFGAPVKKGGRYFYAHNAGLQNQAVLWVRDALNAEGRVLIDPNGWSKDGATALAEWLPSEDGKLLAYSIQDGGTDWRTIKVIDTATGKETGDEVSWAKYTMGLSWAKDGSGFFYSRYPEPPAEAKFQALSDNHKVYFHKLGTAQSADRRMFATPSNPDLSHYAQVSDDGRWLVVSRSVGTAPCTGLPVLEPYMSSMYSVARAPRRLIATDDSYRMSPDALEQALVARTSDHLLALRHIGHELRLLIGASSKTIRTTVKSIASWTAVRH